ncbi:substrate-binding domain-containing protein [Phyllobacterium endophyticum]|jgi:ribose transport system substrate-binding protein|uniref:Sugar ABC transporter substrate-binding protein n=1 Tax=Phyllobacterium endophyticum TaxID=1149773 RepID=A0A2P7AMJ2_9HYPH|nr:substrate-binding domain-containing protein [Phyllobacterium endophyticum]MBB3238346.1 ribose transport system substrate-binding protein [Phyllobacterium endophyticum]PSH55430.1 sugar ABC transporter substrate-binding protein [Phyllobacterium endophyticum]TXR48841.1 sugar ABC transporter substrate-binding protein [Phyllobacterium endophyticum]TYR40158.1 sugar ABC transporter substrate-binding protein [Phyllobacterium endophyticum]
MKKSLLLVAAAALALGAGPALAKKQLVIVVKGLDNPFFEAIHQGCEKWNSENASSEYECFYTGPASTSDEAGEAQIVQDMLGKADTAAIAISPSNAKLIAQTIKTANPSVPVMTLDADLAAEDAALRKTYLGTDNYLMGFKIGEYIKKAKPNGGTICTIEGNTGADNILRRAQGMRDALTGQKGIEALKGEGGWTEVAGCPVFTNDDGAKGVQAMTDILAANPKLDAFGIMGGWPLFGAPQPYRDLFKPYKDKIASNEFVIGAADTIGEEVAIAGEGLVTALVGQRPFEMGYKAPSVMIDLIEGKPVEDPVFTGLDECTKDTVATCIQK